MSNLRYLLILFLLVIMSLACLGPRTMDPQRIEATIEAVETILPDLEIPTLEDVGGYDQDSPLSTSELYGIPLGEWRVTKLTGEIRDERSGGGVDILCPYFNSTYSAILDSEDTRIVLLAKSTPMDNSNIPEDKLKDINLFDADGVFIFSFAFSNGYHSNEVLSGNRVQTNYIELIPEAYSMYFGYWSDEKIVGSTQIGAPGGGNSRFDVTGEFKNQARIEGTWTFQEVTALPGGAAQECNTNAFGEGDWVAEYP